MRIVVVGAGICGAGVAYHASRGGADVLLVDDEADGRATDAGAGIVCPWTSRTTDPHWHEMANASAAYYPELVAALAEDGAGEVGYRRVGALRLASDDAELETLHRTVLRRRGQSPEAGEVSLLSGADARALFPPLEGSCPAVHVAGAARVDGRKIRDALLTAARRHGARSMAGTAALREGPGGCGIEVAGEAVPADALMLAAGAWTGDLLAPLGVSLDVAPQRGQIVHLGLSGVDTSRWPVVLPPGSHYLLAFDDSRVVVGATREAGSGFDYRVTAAGLVEVLHEALAVAPGLAEAAHLETRVGFRPVGPDARPLLGTVPGVGNIVVATGLGASGLTLGPYVARQAAALALGERPDIDLSPYDPERPA
jgi:D-amino-acid dehydrogenase